MRCALCAVTPQSESVFKVLLHCCILPDSYLNLAGLTRRNKLLLIYLAKLWKLRDAENSSKTIFIGMERSPGFLSRFCPPSTTTFPCCVPKGKTLVWSPPLKRFSWAAPDELFYAQGMCLEDFRTTATDLRNRLMMNYHDVARLAGNAFHMHLLDS